MNNNEFAIESFISFCDDMMITQESVFTTIKNGLVKLFTNLINFLERQIGKMRDSRVKRSLLSLLGRAKNGLNRSKNIKEGNTQETQEEVEELKQDADDIKKEIDKIIGEDDENPDQEYHNATGDDIVTILRNDKSAKNQYFYQVKICDDEHFDRIKNILTSACDATTFSEYIKHWKEFKKIIKLPEKCTVYALKPYKSRKTFDMYYILENNRPMKKNIKEPLYHTSKDLNLVAITPRWRAEDDPEMGKYYGRFFDTPRAFFGTYPMTRMGMHSRKVDPELSIYKAEGITQAYIDVDGISYGKAVYVEGTSPIKLTKVNFNENGEYEEDPSSLKNDPKYKNVPDDVFPIVSKLDAIRAKEFILNELNKIDVEPNKRSVNIKKWKEFSKKYKCIYSFFKKGNVKLYEGQGSLHGIPVLGPEVRDFFIRFRALVNQSFTEGEMRMVMLLGRNIFINSHDLKTREDIESEAYNDDLY